MNYGSLAQHHTSVDRARRSPSSRTFCDLCFNADVTGWSTAVGRASAVVVEVHRVVHCCSSCYDYIVVGMFCLPANR